MLKTWYVVGECLSLIRKMPMSPAESFVGRSVAEAPAFLDEVFLRFMVDVSGCGPHQSFELRKHKFVAGSAFVSMTFSLSIVHP